MISENSEIEIRKPIWITLSEFYLDTELQDEDFERISKLFISTGLNIKEIKRIDLYEVFPLLQSNLLSPAGAWAGFDEPWLFENCERLYKKRNNWLHRIISKFWNQLFYWMRKDYWIKIEEKLKSLHI